MPIPATGEEYKPANVAELRKAYLDDLALQYERMGIPDPDLGEGSDAYMRAEAGSRARFAIYSNISLARRDSSELTAKGEALDDIREALAIPEVKPEGAAGKIKATVRDGATVTYFEGTEFRLDKNNKVGAVSETQSGIQDGDPVDVIMIDTGADTNAEEGEKIRWVDPPFFAEIEGEVGPGGLVGGTGDETDDEKRARIKTRRQNIPGAGNNAHKMEVAEGASTGVQKAFVYPVLGGPSSSKTVLMSAVSLDEPKDFSREVPAAIINLVKAAYAAQIPGSDKDVIQSVVDELVDVTLQLKLDNAKLGWKNATPWPQLESADNGRITVSTATSSTDITITANDEDEPEDGVTMIAWWNEDEQSFVTSLVLAHSGTAGAWQVTLATPFTGVEAGDFISPAAVNMAAYAKTWLQQMAKMGPGENTNLAELLAPDRGYRFPRAAQNNSDEWPSELTTVQLTGLLAAYKSEIGDALYSYRSKTAATVPVLIGTAPNVLRLDGFGIYPRI